MRNNNGFVHSLADRQKKNIYINNFFLVDDIVVDISFDFLISWVQITIKRNYVVYSLYESTMTTHPQK